MTRTHTASCPLSRYGRERARVRASLPGCRDIADARTLSLTLSRGTGRGDQTWPGAM
jgi:hypothetical protein